VREFFIENALMWLLEYRFDGLRLDAVHAIEDPGFPHRDGPAHPRADRPESGMSG
jgi:1,4-alpha-glucan branching enzyme